MGNIIKKLEEAILAKMAKVPEGDWEVYSAPKIPERYAELRLRFSHWIVDVYAWCVRDERRGVAPGRGRWPIPMARLGLELPLRLLDSVKGRVCYFMHFCASYGFFVGLPCPDGVRCISQAIRKVPNALIKVYRFIFFNSHVPPRTHCLPDYESTS